jgi:ABC-type methionine transport system permease subunit
MHYDTLSLQIICRITQHPELLFISSNLRTFASIPEGIVVIICNRDENKKGISYVVIFSIVFTHSLPFKIMILMIFSL